MQLVCPEDEMCVFNPDAELLPIMQTVGLTYLLTRYTWNTILPWQVCFPPTVDPLDKPHSEYFEHGGETEAGLRPRVFPQASLSCH